MPTSKAPSKCRRCGTRGLAGDRPCPRCRLSSPLDRPAPRKRPVLKRDIAGQVATALLAPEVWWSLLG